MIYCIILGRDRNTWRIISKTRLFKTTSLHIDLALYSRCEWPGDLDHLHHFFETSFMPSIFFFIKLWWVFESPCEQAGEEWHAMGGGGVFHIMLLIFSPFLWNSGSVIPKPEILWVLFLCQQEIVYTTSGQLFCIWFCNTVCSHILFKSQKPKLRSHIVCHLALSFFVCLFLWNYNNV